MLSPGHLPIGSRTPDAGTNPLASGHYLSVAHQRPAAGNNLDSGQIHVDSQVGHARVNPLTPGHRAPDTQRLRAGAILRRAVRQSTTTDPTLVVLTPATLAPLPSGIAPGPFSNHEAREQ